MKAATYEFTKSIEVLFNAKKVFKNPDKKKEVAHDLLSCLLSSSRLLSLIYLKKIWPADFESKFGLT